MDDVGSSEGLSAGEHHLGSSSPGNRVVDTVGNVSAVDRRLGCDPVVAVVEPADLRRRDDTADRRRHDATRDRRVLIERQMRARLHVGELVSERNDLQVQRRA